MNKWIEKDNQLVRNFEFRDFKEAIEFINKVAQIAENKNHHPRILNIYNKVKISLQTHDAGNIVTEKDRHVAELIDQID